MIAALIAFARTKNGLHFLEGAVVVILGLALVLGARSHWIGAGVKREQRAEAKRLEAAQAKVAMREEAAQKISNSVSVAIADALSKNHATTKVLIEKVPRYVTPAADSKCVVPAGFVRLHEVAAFGSTASVSGPPSGPVDTASGIPLSSVASVVAFNYGVAHDWKAEALGWRAWYAKQKAAWDKK